MFSSTEATKLFGDLRSIRLLNQVLLDQLENVPSAAHPLAALVEAFEQLTPFLRLYSVYARNFHQSNTLLQVLLKQADFVFSCILSGFSAKSKEIR